MIKRLLGLAASLAFLAGPASAQYTATFQFSGFGSVSSHTNYNDAHGKFTTAAPGFATNSPFQVWCVDLTHTIGTGQNPVNMTVSQLSGPLTSTYQNDVVKYTKAAWLTQQFGGSGDEAQSAQWAIWNVMNGHTACTTTGSATPDISKCNAGAVGTLVTNSVAGASTINKHEWFVLTGVGSDGKHVQEFLAQCQVKADCQPDIPNEDPTPEPATMTLLAIGLAGMAGTSLKRRTRKS